MCGHPCSREVDLQIDICQLEILELYSQAVTAAADQRILKVGLCALPLLASGLRNVMRSTEAEGAVHGFLKT